MLYLLGHSGVENGLLEKTVRCYLKNQSWCERVPSGAYWEERLGLGERLGDLGGSRR